MYPVINAGCPSRAWAKNYVPQQELGNELLRCQIPTAHYWGRGEFYNRLKSPLPPFRKGGEFLQLKLSWLIQTGVENRF